MQKSSGISGDAVRAMIRSALHSADDGHLLHRLDGVLLVAEGHSCGEVAGWFGVNRRTVERWLRAADAQGADGLAEHHPGGRPARLSGDQLLAISFVLQAPPITQGYPERRWTGKRLARHLARLYGLELSERSCQRLIAGNRARSLQRA